MKVVSLLIKPASGCCNLQCKYCFYEDEIVHRETKNCGMMSDAVLETLVCRAFDEAEECVSFAFQGGEPMLAGITFFRKFIELEKQYARPIRIEHSIQTNGTLIDDEWAEFFFENHFLVGISIDGTKELHDRFRAYPNGSGSYKTVVRALRILQQYQVDVNILCVVTGNTARHAYGVYQALKKLSVSYLQFVPCLDPITQPSGTMEYSLTPELYGNFLCTLFDCWYLDWSSGNYVSIRLFDDYVHILAGQSTNSCATNGTCGQYFTVEGDGSVYPCDFFALDEWCMGNVSAISLTELAEVEPARRFCKTGRSIPDACTSCQWVRLCRGGCQRDRSNGVNYHCEAFRKFFDYAISRLCKIACLERQLCAAQSVTNGRRRGLT